MKQFDLAAYQASLHKEVVAFCEQGGEPQRMAELARRVVSQAEKALSEQTRDNPVQIACRAGCGSCCIVNVSVLFPEAMRVADYLRTQADLDLPKLQGQLDRLWIAVRGLDEEERIGLRKACVFLGADGCCEIYPVRPLLCRAVTSVDEERCRQAITGQYFDEVTPVVMHLAQYQIYEASYLALGQGLEEAGLDGRGFQATGLIRYLLRNPAAQADLSRGKRLKWAELS